MSTSLTETGKLEFAKAELANIELLEEELPAPSGSAESLRSGNGFFSSFNPTTYRSYLRGLSNAALRKKEISKIEAEYSYQMGVTAGVVHGIATFGVTAATAVFAARNLYLANKKLPLVREEMARRGLEFHMVTGKDVWNAAKKNAPRILLGISN